MAPILTRLYTPDDLGYFGLYVTFLGVASALACLRYELAIVSAEDEHEAAQLATAAALLTLPVSGVAAILLLGLIQQNLLGFGGLPLKAVIITAAAVVVVGLFGVLRYWLLRAGKFSVISRAIAVQSGARAGFQVAFGLGGMTFVGLMVGDVLGRLVGTLNVAWKAAPQVAGHVGALGRRQVVRVLRRYWKFPTYGFPSSFIDTVAQSLPIPLLVVVYGPAAAGFFALVQRVLAMPASLVAGSVADVFHNRMAQFAREQDSGAQRLFGKTALSLLSIGMVPAAVVFFLGERLFGFVFGPTWVTSGVLAAAVVPWSLAQLVVSPLSRIVVIFDRQELKLIYDIATLVGTIGVFVLSFRMELSLVHCVALLSALNVATYLVYFLLLVHMVRRSAATAGGTR